MPLLVILIVMVMFNPEVFAVLFAVVSIMILVPKFFQWRRTAYALTPELMIYQRGGILSTRRYQIPMERVKEVKSRPGMFGKYLGYQHVEVRLDSGARASLMYLPASLDVEGHFMDLIAKAKAKAGAEGGSASGTGSEAASAPGDPSALPSPEASTTESAGGADDAKGANGNAPGPKQSDGNGDKRTK